MVKTYKIEIEGIVPILLNKYDHDLNKEKTAVPKGKKEDWEEENWQRKAYYNNNDEIILPDTYIMGSIRSIANESGIQASKKGGKAKALSKAFIDGSLILDFSPVIGNKEDLVPFKTNVKIAQSTIMSTRPKLDNWVAVFDIIDLNEVFLMEEIKALIEYAGKFKGVGDWRPKFGRYKLNKIEEVC